MKSVSLEKVESEEQIRKAAAIADRTWRDHYASILSPGQIEYMLETIQSPEAIREQIAGGYLYFIIESGEERIGYCALKLNDPASSMFLSKFYLLSDFRGQGYGRASLEKFDDIARNAHQDSIWLTVNRGNPSIEAYKAFGFDIEDTKVTDIGGGYVMDDYIMRRAVPKGQEG